MNRSFGNLEPQNILEILTRIYHKVQEEQSTDAKQIIDDMVDQLEALLEQ
ncbi:hypothetical protein [Ammoniphilus sp. CFH 90114]|nr:hypothetical protein [Ammoniphilus sp. CFH 90114]